MYITPFAVIHQLLESYLSISIDRLPKGPRTGTFQKGHARQAEKYLRDDSDGYWECSVDAW